jgi:DNA-binding transcriptional ArsR family regulator
VLKHLRVLEAAGLVAGERRGRERRYRLLAAPMREASSWLDIYRSFWDAQLDALADYLEESKS